MASSADPEHVDFYFDPMCPWAFEASRWIRQVRERIGLEIRWRFFSLELVNLEAHQRFPWERSWSWGWSMMRVAAHLRREDPELLDRWYLENGTAFFERGESVFLPDGAKEILRRIGLPPSRVDEAIADESTHEDVLSDHEHLTEVHGGHGVPTLVFDDGHALYGPAVIPAPAGDAAVRLWDALAIWRELPHLYEIRRPKTGADIEYIEGRMATYLEARPWRTIENAAP
jgi:predicted DsbA family dithiol-disulfide isomerase